MTTKDKLERSDMEKDNNKIGGGHFFIVMLMWGAAALTAPFIPIIVGALISYLLGAIIAVALAFIWWYLVCRLKWAISTKFILCLYGVILVLIALHQANIYYQNNMQ